jgi:hypothetical protein
VRNPFQDQPLGYVEPDYDGIDGLAWAWNGGSNHVENVVGGIAEAHEYFSGFRNDGTSTATRMVFRPDRQIFRTSGADWTMEIIHKHISRSANNARGAALAIGPADLSSQSIGIGRVQNSNNWGVVTGTSGFQNYNSGLGGAGDLGAWIHFILTRYRGRMYTWFHNIESGEVSRNLDAAPPSNAMTVSGEAFVVLLKEANTGATWVGDIAKAAIYNRGMPEAEAEALLRDPWITFKTRRSRIDTILQPVVSAFNPAWARGSNQYLGGGLHA